MCPLAADWGNASEIASAGIAAFALVIAVLGVVVGAAGTIAVAALGVRTNQIARAANATNLQMVDLELKRENEARLAVENEQRLILISISYPLGRAFASVNAIREMYRQPVFEIALANDADVRRSVVEMLRIGLMTLPEATRARLHQIDPRLAGRIARAESSVPTFITAVEGIGVTNADVAALGARNLGLAVEREAQELMVVLRACQTACHEVGIPFTMPIAPGLAGADENEGA